MDPWLEDARIWPDVHNRLIAAIGDHLGPILRPRYYVGLEERTYLDGPDDLVLVGVPDVTVSTAAAGPPHSEAASERSGARSVLVDLPIEEEVRETYLVVRTAHEGRAVTVIEILSPSNKQPGRGRDLYEAKRREILATRTSLVEIDLLRAGRRTKVLRVAGESDYRILVARGLHRPRGNLLLFGVRDPIPAFPVPLLPGDAEPPVELGPILGGIYDRASYDLRVDYAAEPEPPLAEADRAWADGLLRQAGRRG